MKMRIHSSPKQRDTNSVVLSPVNHKLFFCFVFQMSITIQNGSRLFRVFRPIILDITLSALSITSFSTHPRATQDWIVATTIFNQSKQ